LGGAVFTVDGTTILLNDTLDANTVAGGKSQIGGLPAGGAVYNLAFGNDIRTGATQTSSLVMQNSILANTTGGSDLSGQAINGAGTNTATITGSYNLVMSNDGSINPAPGTISGTGDPQLGMLQNNGGLTPTMLPSSGSPVLGAGAATLAPATDQRGQPRPLDGPTDLGAVQVSVAPTSGGGSTGGSSTGGGSTSGSSTGGSTSGGSTGATPTSAGFLGLAVEEFELTLDLLLASNDAGTGIQSASLNAAISQLQTAIDNDPLLLTLEGQIAVMLGERLALSALGGR
jgi:hypothetical protein